MYLTDFFCRSLVILGFQGRGGEGDKNQLEKMRFS